MKEKKKDHYIDNKEFLAAMKVWKLKVKECEDSGDPHPPVSEYIGKCFFDIATQLATKSNFSNYPFAEDMVGDAIENCLAYAHNFDPDVSSNPFSYFTQISYYAFLRRIQKEKKQLYVKYKKAEQLSDNLMKTPGWTDDYLMKKIGINDQDLESVVKRGKKKK